MLEQLDKDPIKIPFSSRNEMMFMLLKEWETLEIDTKMEFKRVRCVGQTICPYWR